MAESTKPTRLNPLTLRAFEAYIRKPNAEMEQTLLSSNPFLWSDANAERTKRIRGGQILAQFWSGQRPVEVPNGLIHDWIGAAFLPSIGLTEILTLMQDYNNHKNIYKPEVINSKLLSRRHDDFRIYLRLLKKKIITIVLDTDHIVQYRSVDPTRWTCLSYTTRIAEVENAGSPKETVLAPDTGYGFLWRLNSYWRLQERDGGVYFECRAISLTRDVPLGLRWVIEPIIQKLPKESLIKTLESTRAALHAESKKKA